MEDEQFNLNNNSTGESDMLDNYDTPIPTDRDLKVPIRDLTRRADTERRTKWVNSE